MMVEDDHLELVASEGRHTFVSTGMSTLDEIDKAVEIFKKSGCSFELMHCVSTYPMEDTDANLKCIPMLRERGVTDDDIHTILVRNPARAFVRKIRDKNNI